MANLCFHSSFFMFSLLCLMACTALSKTNFTTDESALLTLKASLTSDPYNVMANWSAPSSHCNWVGVTCDAGHQRVKILNLGEMGLKGTIPPQLGNLSFLVQLDLRSNNFHGQLPKELAQLRRLKLLNLSYNELSGEIPTWMGGLFTLQHLILRNNSFGGVIPPSISNLSKLETLDWNYNFIEGSIPLEIGRLQHLKNLRISRNKLSGSIPPTISNLSSLELIALSYNSLTGHIPNEIGDLSELKIIYLCNNQLSGPIPKSIGNLTLLQEIELCFNKLEGDIPKEIGHLQNLETIKWMDNKLDGHLPRDIGNMTMLQKLILYDNSLTGSVPKELGDLSKLKELKLGTNNLRGFIPTKIFNISTLINLSLEDNSLSGSLPSYLGYGLPNLQWLFLWTNKLSGRIPSSISNSSKLTRIELSDNEFGGMVPSTLGDLRYLEFLSISMNSLTVTPTSNSESSFLSSLTNCRLLKFLDFSINPLYIKLPKSVGNLSNSLQELWALSCGINGNIPLEIGNLSNLIRLHLEENDFNGSIPVTISNLKGLQLLDLGDNNLHGSITEKLCEIPTLGSLHLSGNKFSGVMPFCLGNLSLLRDLDLSSNRLISDIPFSLWNLKDILWVNLSSNILAGNLPLGIQNLKAIISLDLSKNHISGNIPITVGGLQMLQTLSLAVNQLEGSIPGSLGNMISLKFLDFSQNNLSGVIPHSLESLVSLQFVNLSYNKLQGEIPSGGVFKNLTAESFIMNKALCGKPQLQVPPCKKGARQRSKTKLLLLKYIVPMVVSTIFVVSIIVLLRHKRQNSSNIVERDLSTSGAPRRVSYFEILQATNGFDSSNLLGRGSFGSVFKGNLSSGLIVAIKVFNLDSEVMSRSFDVECDSMRNLRHRNIVKIISSCSNVDFKSLVMEFMPNGSLEKWLYSHNYCLDFLQRLNLMIDVASALEYLHHGLSTPMVHCDLKPSNILLDDDMVAHVSDFGISKLLDKGQSKTHTETMPTVGYIAPEYGSVGVVSIKVDVYSYGIMLMEVFTRKKPTDDMFVSGLNLESWVSESVPHEIIQVIDSNLLQGDEQHISNIMTSTSSIFELALNCCSNSPEARSNMTNIVVSLKKIKVMFMRR